MSRQDAKEIFAFCVASPAAVSVFSPVLALIVLLCGVVYVGWR